MRDLEELTHDVFAKEAKYLGDIEATKGSIIISWLFTESVTSQLQQSAKERASLLDCGWVEEVKIAGILAYPVKV